MSWPTRKGTFWSGIRGNHEILKDGQVYLTGLFSEKRKGIDVTKDVDVTVLYLRDREDQNTFESEHGETLGRDLPIAYAISSRVIGSGDRLSDLGKLGKTVYQAASSLQGKFEKRDFKNCRSQVGVKEEGKGDDSFWLYPMKEITVTREIPNDYIFDEPIDIPLLGDRKPDKDVELSIGFLRVEDDSLNEIVVERIDGLTGLRYANREDYYKILRNVFTFQDDFAGRFITREMQSAHSLINNKGVEEIYSRKLDEAAHASA